MIFLIYYCFILDPPQNPDDFKIHKKVTINNKQKRQENTSSSLEFNIFPKLVHHTWNAHVSVPTEIVRWEKGCKKINPDFKFTRYSDEDLAIFAKEYYPEYLPLFNSLKGVCT
jgi:mannosyltransferase OCH1-like enzyme